MGFRRKREDAARGRAWDQFREQHIDEIRRIGLTDPVVYTKERFIDFLMHGYIDHHDDPSGYSVHQMSDDQHAIFVTFVDSFMAAFGQLSDSELIAPRLARFPRRNA